MTDATDRLTPEAMRMADLFSLIVSVIWPDVARGVFNGFLQSESNEVFGDRTCAWAYNQEADALGITMWDRNIPESEQANLVFGDEDWLYAIPNFRTAMMMASVAAMGNILS